MKRRKTIHKLSKVHSYSTNDNCFILVVILIVSDSKFFQIDRQIYYLLYRLVDFVFFVFLHLSIRLFDRVDTSNYKQFLTNLFLLPSSFHIRIAGYSERFWKETRTRIPLVAGAEQSVRLLGSRYLAAGRIEEVGRIADSFGRFGGRKGVGVLAPETGEYRGNELCRIRGALIPSFSCPPFQPLVLFSSLCRTFASGGGGPCVGYGVLYPLPFSFSRGIPSSHRVLDPYPTIHIFKTNAIWCGAALWRQDETKLIPPLFALILPRPLSTLPPPFLCRSFSLSLAHALFGALLAVLFCRWLPRKQGCFHVASRSFLSTFFPIDTRN